MKSVIINTTVSTIVCFMFAFAGYCFALKHNPCDTIATYPDGNHLHMITSDGHTDINFNFNGVITLNIDPSETLELYNDLLHMQTVLDKYAAIKESGY